MQPCTFVSAPATWKFTNLSLLKCSIFIRIFPYSAPFLYTSFFKQLHFCTHLHLKCSVFVRIFPYSAPFLPYLSSKTFKKLHFFSYLSLKYSVFSCSPPKYTFDCIFLWNNSTFVHIFFQKAPFLYTSSFKIAFHIYHFIALHCG